MNNPYISGDYARRKNLYIFKKCDWIGISDDICKYMMKLNSLSLECIQNMIYSTGSFRVMNLCTTNIFL